MVAFQTKKIQSLFGVIIVLAVILWVYQDDFFKISLLQEKTEPLVNINEVVKEKPYLEKIENFLVKEYSENQLLLHTIKAETYFSYKDSPVILLEIVVKTYDKSQQENLVVKSNRAKIMKSGDVVFNGDVNIVTKSGVLHQLDTEELTLLTESNQIKSESEITYLGIDEKITSQGMEMNQDSDTIYLNGEVKIKQDFGPIINTTNLFVNHYDGNKIYQSKGKTVYSSEDNTVSSEQGIDADMNKDLLNLLGKVNILGVSGSTIDSFNLTIDQSNGGEVFKSNDLVHYQATGVNIKAKEMYYDVPIKKIELKNEVSAVYE
ncbi:LPS export ABC transporter periplasmic protein LptC [Candidatus Thioglobus sp.]|nr:LPS export ABC transporter periplasmic protein LptC [Candidatus Thioglobus sp.]